MGSMSASDAAPLPRLGEVYFDVRGESRSMRLSWYADTGVAVFSIWQGGTCTGTFRLPIADLPRMVEALQRGPHGDARGDARDPRESRGPAEQRGRADQRVGQLPEPDTGYSDPGFPAAYAGHQPGYGEEPPTGYLDPAGRGHRGEPGTAAYREDQGGEHRRAGAHGRYDAPGDCTGDPLTGRHPVAEPYPSRYPEEDPHQPRYQDDPLTGRYHEDPHPSRYPDEDPHQSWYPEEEPRRAQYSKDPLTGAYPDDPHTGNAGYSPARPYVAPVPGSTAPAAEGRDHGRRRAADREEDDLSPGSFPYGRPPAEPEPPSRGR